MAKFCKHCGHALTTLPLCLSCGAFRTRLSRALKLLKEGGLPHVVEGFNMIGKEEKAKFKKRHVFDNASSLIMAIRQRVKHRQRRELLQRAFATGHMLDEAELKEKYASKPDQLKNIFEMP